MAEHVVTTSTEFQRQLVLEGAKARQLSKASMDRVVAWTEANSETVLAKAFHDANVAITTDANVPLMQLLDAGVKVAHTAFAYAYRDAVARVILDVIKREAKGGSK